MAPLLDISGLSVTYYRDGGHIEALREVSLVLRRQEFAALIGTSGCGKSTFVRAVLGLLPRHAAASGRIVFDGRELLRQRGGGRGSRRGASDFYRRIGFVPQDPAPALNPVRRVDAQMLDVCRLVHGLDHEEAVRRCRSLLAALRLNDPERVMRAYPHELSGGMAQRVVLAMALTGDPVLLVADEPTSALDAVIRTDLMDDIRAVQRSRGLGVLLVSHDLRLVGRYADSIHVMRDGRILEHGPAPAMLAAPATEHARALLRAGNAA